MGGYYKIPPLLRSGEKGAAGIPAACAMKNSIPEGFTAEQWAAVTEGLREKSGTINDYRKVINLLARHYSIDQITRDEAEAYFTMLDQQAKTGKLSANTVHRYKATLRSAASRMEKHPELWPGYHNPFKGLLGEEERQKTAYTADTFASGEDIRRIISVIPEFSIQEQIILQLMLFAGLSPAQIQQLKVSSFHLNDRNQLEMKAELGTLVEHTDLPWRQSPFYLSGLPVSYVTRSASHTITWRYTGTFIFHEEMQNHFIKYYPYTGTARDERAFFLTRRHQEYSYRSIHRVVCNACQKAGLEAGAATPHQLTLHGMVYSWNSMNRNIKNNTGEWKDRYPVPMQNQMDQILKQLSAEEISSFLASE